MPSWAWIMLGVVAGVGIGLFLCLLKVGSDESRREEQRELAERIVQEGRG